MKTIFNVIRFISELLDAIFEAGYDLLKKVLVFSISGAICIKVWQSDTSGKRLVICILGFIVGIAISTVISNRLDKNDKKIVDLEETQCEDRCKCNQCKSHFAREMEYHKYFNEFISRQNGNGKK